MESLAQIVEQIKLNKDNLLTNDSDLFWKELFIYHFVKEESYSGQDDLLFFIYKYVDKLVKNFNNLSPKIEVMRNISPKLPLHLCSINWEETLFLNLILQKLEYSILFSVCTRTSSNHYQVLTKQKLALFATPSSHSVLCKESTEQYSYPYINFYIENFEEFLYGNIINDLESVYLELVAKDFSTADGTFVLFSSWINYKSINEAYCNDNKIIYNGQCFGVLQIRDYNTEAQAEIVVKKKIKRSISDGSTFFNGLDLDHKSDTALDLYLVNLNRKAKFSNNLQRTSAIRYVGKCMSIEASDVFPDLNDDLTDMWNEKGFSQAYFQWKERHKNASNSFHSFVTNICLPWHHIINQVLSSKKQCSLLYL